MSDGPNPGGCVDCGCGLAFLIVLLCGAVAVGWKLLKWGEVVS